jgi:hypothetical protein
MAPEATAPPSAKEASGEAAPAPLAMAAAASAAPGGVKMDEAKKEEKKPEEAKTWKRSQLADEVGDRHHPDEEPSLARRIERGDLLLGLAAELVG